MVGLLLPVPVHVEELKKLHRFRLCFVLLVNRSRAEGEAICKEKGASKLQESARQDENFSTLVEVNFQCSRQKEPRMRSAVAKNESLRQKNDIFVTKDEIL